MRHDATDQNNPQPIFSYDMAMSLYRDIIKKICNTRFGDILTNYSKKNASRGKGKLALRASLLGMKSKREDETTTTQKQKSSTAASASTASSTTAASTSASSTDITTVVTSPITNLSPGVNGAVNVKILDGKTFVIDGAFEEVHSYAPGAIQSITTMIVSFGGSVQSRISKNIRKYTLNNIATIIVVYLSLLTFTFAMSDDVDYLLAGRGVSSDKIKTATNEKNKATVINLPRLQKLLLGQLTLDNLKEMDKLTSKSFSKKNYVRAEVLQSSTQNATTNN